VSFESGSDIKAHYGTAFHTANLKRRVAELAPLTAETFARLSAERAAAAAASEAAAAEQVLYICDACHKTFASEGQFSAHLASTRHKERIKEIVAVRRAERKAAAAAAAAAAAGAGAGAGAGSSTEAAEAADPASAAAGGSSSSAEEQEAAAGSGAAAAGSEEGAAEEEEEGDLEVTDTHCIFCWAPSDSVEANLLHMRAVHSFAIPDAEFCCDPSGLIEHLHERVIEGRYCLYCDSVKQYDCPESAQRHMADKGHAMLRYDCERHFEELEDFFDYTGAPELAETERDASGNMILPSGKVILCVEKDMARYFKQRFAPPDERDSVRTVMGRLALAYDGNSDGSSRRSAAASVSAAAASALLRSGTRGKATPAAAQRSSEKSFARFRLQIGVQQNQIRRRFFRVQTTLTGRTG
jgi:pre-60S factor REI1